MLACGSGTHTVECDWHRELFQLPFSRLAMPGDIFVFIAGAGSCLQVLIIDCSSSTREPVCEAPPWESLSHRQPFSAAGNELFGLDVVVQLVPPVACSASTDPRQLLLLLGGRSWQGETRMHLYFRKTPQADKYLCMSGGCSSTLPQSWWTCRPLRRPVQPWTWISLFRFGSKKHVASSQRAGAVWFPRFHIACTAAWVRYNSISCAMQGSSERLIPPQMNICFLQGISLAALIVPAAVMAGWCCTTCGACSSVEIQNINWKFSLLMAIG